MRILGVDPGTRRTGYGVLELVGDRLTLVTCGAITTRARDPVSLRLKTIHERLAEIIAACRPEALALEEAYYGKSVPSAIRIGEARAIALLCAAQAGIPVFEYPPAVVKKASVGVGTAHKSQVQTMVQRILGLAAPPEPEDAADALAIAICHCHRVLWGAGRGAGQ